MARVVVLGLARSAEVVVRANGALVADTFDLRVTDVTQDFRVDQGALASNPALDRFDIHLGDLTLDLLADLLTAKALQAEASGLLALTARLSVGFDLGAFAFEAQNMVSFVALLLGRRLSGDRDGLRKMLCGGRFHGILEF